MSYPPHTFAAQGNPDVPVPPGPSTPTQWLDDNFAAAAAIDLSNSPAAAILQAGNLKAQFGASGNGTTDDTASVTSAASSGQSVFAQAGVYSTTIATGNSINGRFWGFGQIKTADGNKAAPWFSAVNAVPTSFGDYDSIETAFNGQFLGQIEAEHRIGVNGQEHPTTGFVQRPDESWLSLYGGNSGGWNNSTSDQTGRTGAALFSIKLDQFGQGDFGAFSVQGLVGSSRSGATHWYANPGVGAYGATLNAFADGAYLNTMEMQNADNGHDVASIILAASMNRTNATGALDTTWITVKSQSTGTAPIDAHMEASGLTRMGLDFSSMLLGTTGNWIQSAIALPTNARIYFDTPPPTGQALFAPSAGNTFLGISGGSFVLGHQTNGPWLSMYTGGMITSQPLYQALAATVTPTANGVLGIQATSNTSLTFKYKGSDGVVRSASLTLA